MMSIESENVLLLIIRLLLKRAELESNATTRVKRAELESNATTRVKEGGLSLVKS